MAQLRNVEDNRKNPRFAISLPASLLAVSDHGGTLVSIGAGGCAIRTTHRLENKQRYLVGVQILEQGVPETYQIPAEVVWGQNDYRIDSFYKHGLKFEIPLNEALLTAILRAAKEASHLRTAV